jgi:uncharacterized protein (UPF0333 family)
MNKKIIIPIILIAIGAFIYYQTSQTKTTNTEIISTSDTSVTDAVHDYSASAKDAISAGTRIIVKNDLFQTGNQTISFDLYAKNGNVISNTDLNIVHEKKMHAIIASSDFSDYQHVHPEFKEGSWQMPVTLMNNTMYQVYIDISSDAGGQETLRFPINVGDPQFSSKVSQREIILTQDAISVELVSNNEFMAGKDILISFNISQDGKSIIPENYLGKKVHVVALGDDPNTYVHGHPIDNENEDITVALNFNKGGIHTLFVELQVMGVVRIFPFTVFIADALNTHDESVPHSH